MTDRSEFAPADEPRPADLPPLPPPLPGLPVDYASYAVATPGKLNFFQQAARASWVAPTQRLPSYPPP
jgi:hypothetical protein